MKHLISVCFTAVATAGLLATSLVRDAAAGADGAAGIDSVVYVANANGTTVTALSGDGLQPVHADIDAAHSPVAIALSPDGRRVYTTGDAPAGSITVIDARTNERITTVELVEADRIGALVVSPDGTRVYATAESEGTIVVFDVATNQKIDSFDPPRFGPQPSPSSIDVSTDGTAIFEFSQVDSNVAKLATADGEQLANFFVAQQTRELKTSTDGNTLVVAGLQAVQFLRTTDLRPVSGPTYVFIGPMVDVATAGPRTYALNTAYQTPPMSMAKGAARSTAQEGAPSIDVYETADGTYVESIDLGFGPAVQGIAVTADGACAYVTRWDSGDAGTVTAVDLQTGALGVTASVGAFPRRIVVTPPTPVVDAFFLPKKVATKTNATTPSKSVFKASGFFDTGSEDVDLTAPSTLSLGGLDIEISALAAAKNGRTFTYASENVQFVVTKNRSGSSRAKFRLTYKGDLGAAVAPNGNLTLRFRNDAVDGTCVVLLENGGFRIGKKRGALSQPSLFVVRARAAVRGEGKDSLSVVAGLATDGTTPETASEVHVRLGSRLDVTIPADAFTRKKDSWKFKGDVDGITSVVVDYRREQVTVVGRNLDLGAFPPGQSAVTLLIGVGDEERGVAVRVARKKNALKY